LEEGWARLFKALHGTDVLLQSRNIDFLLLIMPSRYLFQEAGQYTQYARRIFVRACRLAEEYSLPYLDLSRAVEQGGGAKLFFDFAHLTAQGNRIVAEELARHFNSRVDSAASGLPSDMRNLQ
jgi:hypothetical protein